MKQPWHFAFQNLKILKIATVTLFNGISNPVKMRSTAWSTRLLSLIDTSTLFRRGIDGVLDYLCTTPPSISIHLKLMRHSRPSNSELILCLFYVYIFALEMFLKPTWNNHEYRKDEVDEGKRQGGNEEIRNAFCKGNTTNRFASNHRFLLIVHILLFSVQNDCQLKISTLASRTLITLISLSINYSYGYQLSGRDSQIVQISWVGVEIFRRELILSVSHVCVGKICALK